MPAAKCNYCNKPFGVFNLVCQHCGTKISKRITVTIGVTVWTIILSWIAILLWFIQN